MVDKKVVLITGCSDGGLGSKLALAFHKTGHYRVIATARNLAKLNDTRKAGIEDLQLDVLSKDSIASCVKGLEALTGGRLDMLLNNAGGVHAMPMLDIDLDQARKVFDLNVWSLVTVSKAFVALLLETPKSKIVNNISVVAYTCPPIQGVYNASKAAANSITENLRLELKPFGVQVIALITGGVKSNIEGNAEKNALPEDSIYRVVPGGLKRMKQSDFDQMDGDIWAAHVVGDLSKATPSHQIWRGSSAWLVRLSTVLPIGTFDKTLLQLSGFDEVEKALERSKDV